MTSRTYIDGRAGAGQAARSAAPRRCGGPSIAQWRVSIERMSEAPTSVEGYIAAAPEAARPMLEQMRAIVRDVVPGATEGMSYGVPTFKNPRALVSYGAAKNHCSFYVMSSTAMEPFADELEGFDTAKGTIRFKFGQPLPEDLIRRLVEARIAENQKAQKRA